MFQFSSFAPARLYIHRVVIPYDRDRVAPFGNPRIKSCLHFPEAYRSLPRPSSPARAKAFPICPW